MTVVVTGAAGHLGANLVRTLLAGSREVRALDFTRDWRALAGLVVDIVEGDIRDGSALERAFRGAESVYHAAARISLSRRDEATVMAINVDGTRNVVEACLRAGVRKLIHFSSIHAFAQEPLKATLDESRPLVDDPRATPYDRSKAAGEGEVRRGIARGLHATILNPTGMIGPHDYGPSYFGRVLLALAEGRMPVFLESGFDWVDVRDVVRGAMVAEATARPGSQYLLSGRWVPMRELARLVAEIASVPAPRIYAPMELARLGVPLAETIASVRHRPALLTSVSLQSLRGNPNVSHARAAQDLGFSPRPFRETLEDTLRWYQAAGLLPTRMVIPQDE